MDKTSEFARYETVQIDKIQIPESGKPLDKEKIRAMAASLQEIGLQNPIGLTPDYRLLHGRHRLEAFKSLGWKEIPSTIHPLDGLYQELATIDENLERRVLTDLEESQALARRKEIFEQLHPEARHGGSRKGKARGSSGQNGHSKSFADDTAAMTGRSARSIRRDVAAVNAIEPAVRETIASTPLANSRGELAKLAKLPAEQQREVAEKVAAGEVKTVDEAMGDAQAADIAKSVQEGLRGLGLLVQSLKALGIYDRHSTPLGSIKADLEACQAGRRAVVGESTFENGEERTWTC